MLFEHGNFYCQLRPNQPVPVLGLFLVMIWQSLETTTSENAYTCESQQAQKCFCSTLLRQSYSTQMQANINKNQSTQRVHDHTHLGRHTHPWCSPCRLFWDFFSHEHVKGLLFNDYRTKVPKSRQFQETKRGNYYEFRKLPTIVVCVQPVRLAC